MSSSNLLSARHWGKCWWNNSALMFSKFCKIKYCSDMEEFYMEYGVGSVEKAINSFRVVRGEIEEREKSSLMHWCLTWVLRQVGGEERIWGWIILGAKVIGMKIKLDWEIESHSVWLVSGYKGCEARVGKRGRDRIMETLYVRLDSNCPHYWADVEHSWQEHGTLKCVKNCDIGNIHLCDFKKPRTFSRRQIRQYS